MKLYSILICLIIILEFQSSFTHLQPRTSEKTQETAVNDLIRRLISERASNFNITVIQNYAVNGKDRFTVSTRKILVFWKRKLFKVLKIGKAL